MGAAVVLAAACAVGEGVGAVGEVVEDDLPPQAVDTITNTQMIRSLNEFRTQRPLRCNSPSSRSRGAIPWDWRTPFGRLIEDEMSHVQTLHNLTELLETKIRDGAALQRRKTRASVTQVAQEFGGEDPLKPVLRAKLQSPHSCRKRDYLASHDQLLELEEPPAEGLEGCYSSNAAPYDNDSLPCFRSPFGRDARRRAPLDYLVSDKLAGIEDDRIGTS